MGRDPREMRELKVHGDINYKEKRGNSVQARQCGGSLQSEVYKGDREHSGSRGK